MGVPARDLTHGDLLDVAEREGVPLAQLLQQVESCGLYVRDEYVDVTPVCGALIGPPGSRQRCQVAVDDWVDRCERHRVAMQALRGVGDEIGAALFAQGIRYPCDLTELDDDEVEALADEVAGVSPRMLLAWRETAFSMRRKQWG
jgi:hypothetical protein